MNDTNKEKKIGNIFGATGGNHAGMVFDKTYLAPALSTMQGGLRQPMIIVKDERIKYYCCASRGRDPDNPSDRNSGNPNLVQRLEINWTGICNTITSVAKDAYVLEMYNE